MPNKQEVHSFQDELPPYDRSILIYDTDLVSNTGQEAGWRKAYFSSDLGFDYYKTSNYSHWCELPAKPVPEMKLIIDRDDLKPEFAELRSEYLLMEHFVEEVQEVIKMVGIAKFREFDDSRYAVIRAVPLVRKEKK